MATLVPQIFIINSTTPHYCYRCRKKKTEKMGDSISLRISLILARKMYLLDFGRRSQECIGKYKLSRYAIFSPLS